MKKLMITAAAALCATLGYSEITSQNVVGYQENNARAGLKAMGASFAAVAGKTIDLTDLVVTGYDKEEGCEEDVKVQILNSLGMGGVTYAWYDLNDDGEIYYGWFADDEVAKGDVVLSPGDALWVSAPNESYKILSSGQVPTEDVVVTLRSGNKLVANPTPISVDLTEIVVAGYDPEEGCEEDVKAQILNNVGMGGVTYAWYDLDDDGEVYYGWFADDEVAEGDVVIGPGEGLWVSAPSTAYTLKFPGVVIK